MMHLTSKKEMITNWETDVFDDKKDPEAERVMGVINTVLGHLSEENGIGYYFAELHEPEDFLALIEDLHPKKNWHTIYDSCYFPVSDGGSYSIIEVCQSNSPDYFYLSVSLGGSIGASALTEYFKVPMLGCKWAWSA
jgi:hypothetical protein